MSRRQFIYLIIFLILVSLYLVRSILTPFVLAALVAYILNPAIKILQRRFNLSRVISIVVISVSLVAFLGLTIYWVGGGLLNEARQINEEDRKVGFWEDSALNQLPEIDFAGTKFSLKPIAQEIPKTLSETATHWQENVWPFVTDALGRLLTAFVFLLSTFYFLKDGHRFVDYFRNLTPAKYRAKYDFLIQDVNKVLGNYLRGQVLLIVIMAVASFVALSILGVKFALTLAVLTGFLELIPYFGPTVATSLAALTVFITADNRWGLDPTTLTALVVVVYISLRLLEDYFVIPQVLGHVTKLHPLLVLLAVLAGGHLYGALGFVIAVPLIATLRLIIRFLIKEVSWKE